MIKKKFQESGLFRKYRSSEVCKCLGLKGQKDKIVTMSQKSQKRRFTSLNREREENKLYFWNWKEKDKEEEIVGVKGLLEKQKTGNSRKNR